MSATHISRGSRPARKRRQGSIPRVFVREHELSRLVYPRALSLSLGVSTFPQESLRCSIRDIYDLKTVSGESPGDLCTRARFELSRDQSKGEETRQRPALSKCASRFQRNAGRRSGRRSVPAWTPRSHPPWRESAKDTNLTHTRSERPVSPPRRCLESGLPFRKRTRPSRDDRSDSRVKVGL